MTVTSQNGTQHFTESQMQALALRFVVEGENGRRRWFVDGKQVSETSYLRAFEAATGQRIIRPSRSA